MSKLDPHPLVSSPESIPAPDGLDVSSPANGARASEEAGAPETETRSDRAGVSESGGLDGQPTAAPPGAMDTEERGLAELMAVRRAKAHLLLPPGETVFPYSFPDTEPIAEVRAGFEHLAPGEETDSIHRVAGRLAARRGQGKAAFLDLVDRSGQIQLHARLDVLGEEAFARLLQLDLGDLLGVSGVAMRSHKGELSLRLESFAVLAKSLRPPPSKHYGLADVETRYRQRELDLMSSESARELFVTRARIISAVRSHLDARGFIEVETPVLQPLYGGALARPFTTHHNALDRTLYLRIATELFLKRCIVGGLERVYELGKDFRNEGISAKHNPEFTMVEWYEAYADYLDEAALTEALVGAVAAAVDYSGDLDFSAPWRRVGFVESIRDATGVDVMAHRDAASLAGAIAASPQIAAAASAGDAGGGGAGAGVGGAIAIDTDGATWPQLADELLSKFVEPSLLQPTFVMDYPLELSPFARAHRSRPGLAERWEAFAGGMEIANAFSELNDPDVQRQRFESQRRLAELGDEETQPWDELFLEALEHGMPPTGGVGLGVDRLVMLLTGRRTIREVVLFPAMRT
jgi:lysyl-tRNA synthetase, class II